MQIYQINLKNSIIMQKHYDITTIKNKDVERQPEHKQFDRQPHFVLDKICKTFVQSNSIISFLLCLTLCMTSLSCRY